MARRCAKCWIACLRCAPQRQPPVQRETASSGSRSIGDWHTGHTAGITKARAVPGRRSSIGANTSGITSPALRTITSSPINKPLRLISSILCSVALVTVTPPTTTGRNRATGVIEPVRPTCTSMSNRVVTRSCAGNLCAIAKRGALAMNPKRFCNFNAFNL